MKRLLVYLFIVLGLGLTFNVNADDYPSNTSVENQYDYTIEFLKVGDYSGAEEAFKKFLKINPNHKLSGNAQYWLAETFRIRQLYTDAASNYLLGYQKYPKSTKGPINLLKLGTTMVKIGEKKLGCKMIIGMAGQYPNARVSVKKKAEYEAKKLKCDNRDKNFLAEIPKLMKEFDIEAKREPSQMQKVAKKNIKFCVNNHNSYDTNTNEYKYKIRRFDNPYYKCKSNFIIDHNYKDELFYAFLVDTIGIVDEKNFRTLEPLGYWKPKVPIKQKKKVKVAKVKEPKQEEFKPKKTNQDNEAPIIEIAEVITVNDTDYEFQGKVTDQAKTIYIEIDGRPTDVKNGKFIVKGYSPVDKQISIEAIDQWGNRSEPKIVKLKIDIKDTIVAEKLEPLNPSKIRSKSSNNKVALIIGIENYLESPSAKYANLDAKYFFDYARKAFGVKKQNINLLVDEEATFVKTNKALTKWLRSKIKADQSDLIIFFAGHGLASSDGKELYLLPQDSDPDLLSRTALSRTELFQEIINLNPKSVTMFLDTCYSGVSRDEKMLLASARPIRIIANEEEGIPNNFTIFSASQLDQISSGLDGAKHGIFSYYLMKGLEGNADLNKDKKITNRELLSYMDQNVSIKALELGREQNPSLAGNPDKVLISYR